MHFCRSDKVFFDTFSEAILSNVLLSNELTDVLNHILMQIPENLDTAEHDSVSHEAKSSLKEANDFLRNWMDSIGGKFNLRKQNLHLKMGRYAPHGRYKPYIWGAFIPKSVKAPSHTTPQLFLFRSSKILGWGLCPSDKARKDSTFMAIYKQVLIENRDIIENLFKEGFTGRDGDNGSSQSNVDDFLNSPTLLLERNYKSESLPNQIEFAKRFGEDLDKLLPLFSKIVTSCISNDLLETSVKTNEKNDLFEKWDDWFYGANDVSAQEVPSYLQSEIGKSWDDLSQVWKIGRRESLKAVDLAIRQQPIPEDLAYALIFGKLRRTAYSGPWRKNVKQNLSDILIEVSKFVKNFPDGCNDKDFDQMIERVRVICGNKIESFVTRILCDLAPNAYLPYSQFTESALTTAAKLLGQTPSKNVSSKNYESLCKEAKRLCEFVPDLPPSEKLYVFDHFLYWLNLESGTEVAPKTENFELSQSSDTKYWKISCGRTGRYAAAHKENGVISIGWGEIPDPRKFNSYEQILDMYKRVENRDYDPAYAARQCYMFSNEIKSGDYIFGYGSGTVILIGIDQGEYDYKNAQEWSRGISNVSESHRNIRKVKWLNTQPVETTRMSADLKKKLERNQTVLPLTEGEAKEILSLAGVDAQSEEDSSERISGISLEELCNISLKPISFFETIERRLLHKRQVVFFGPPGTSKTHIAKHFANWFAKDGEVASVQFHPSYSYEDFVEGYRPSNDSRQFSLDSGVFKKFCTQAMANSKRHVFIVDEINRGNLPQIFGELLHLLEYRNEEVTLPYSKQPFVIPDNVYLVATMNSADRSIAMVDYALRRRFEFFTFPADSSALEKYLEQNNCKVSIKNVVSLFEKINSVIAQELGKHYQVGHTYFMKPNLTEDSLKELWTYSVLPLLEEYFFDNQSALDSLEFEILWNKGSAAA